MQKEIIEKLGVSPVINPSKEIRKIINFLKDFMKSNEGLRTFVLGISGGQDSTLVGKLAQMAIDELNKEINNNYYEFIAVRLPYGIQSDEVDCQLALEFIKPSRILTINIKPAVDASVDTLKTQGIYLTDFLKGNEKARERMKAQYSIAGMFKGVVLGTDHAAENITGFYTKFGDGGADLIPISHLNKRQGKLLLKELYCPEVLYTKSPTADLEDNQPLLKDEDALGLLYDDIDDYLEGKDLPNDITDNIEKRYLFTNHKRNLPITIYDKW